MSCCVLTDCLWYSVIFLFVILLLCVLSPTIKYYAKFTFFLVEICVVSLLTIPVFILRGGRNVTNGAIFSLISYPILSTTLGLQYEVRGKEYLQQDIGCVIVSNHQSAVDVVGMWHIMPTMKRATAVAKRVLLYAFPFGPMAWLAGLIFINRGKKENAKDVMNGVGDQIRDEKVKLWIFPEGTRNSNFDWLPFKKGAFHVAISAQIPILPVVISKYYFINADEPRFDSGKVIITTLPPVPTTGLTKDDVDSLIEKVRSSMIEVFKSTSEEVLNKKTQ